MLFRKETILYVVVVCFWMATCYFFTFILLSSVVFRKIKHCSKLTNCKKNKKKEKSFYKNKNKMENPHNLMDWRKKNKSVTQSIYFWERNHYWTNKRKLGESFRNCQKSPKLSVNFMKFLLCSFVVSSHAQVFHVYFSRSHWITTTIPCALKFNNHFCFFFVIFKKETSYFLFRYSRYILFIIYFSSVSFYVFIYCWFQMAYMCANFKWYN